MKNILLLPIYIIISISSTHAQWDFVNPLPFTYGISCSFFNSDSVGWVAGLDGIMHKTTDGGKTWKRQITNLPESHTLTSIYFINKDTGWTVGLVGHILKTTDGGEHWVAQNSGTQEWLYSVKFVSNNTGYVIGISGIALKTTNGGAQWTVLPSTHAYLYSSQAFSENVLLAFGSVYNINNFPAIIKTTDGGISWQSRKVDSTAYGDLVSCSFIDTLKGWTVGKYGLGYKTTDGGITWMKGIPDSIALSNYSCVSFKDSLNGCISGSYDSLILITSDGGKNWERIPLNSLYNISNVFYTENRLFATGDSGTILYSTDMGLNWNSLNKFVTHSDLQGASFPDLHNVWAVGYPGVIIKSTDAGLTWNQQQSNSTSILYSVLFTDSLNGITCGSGNTILRTTDGGATWDSIIIDSTGNNFNSLFFIDNMNGYCGGTDKRGRSIIFKTTDGGLSWNYLSIIPNEYGLTRMYFKDTLNGWAGCINMYRTTDGGKTWNLQITTSGSIQTIQFIDPLNGWMLSYGELHRTTDGGITWSSYLVKTYVGNACWFVSVSEGWMCGAYGSLYHTTNGGQSWTLQSYSSPGLNYITFNGNTGVAFGDYGTILRTTNGGISFVNNKGISNIVDYNLYQNYPNPFNPNTTIKYFLSKGGQIKITLYNILGSNVATILNEYKQAGSYSIQFNGSNLASGIYFYRLEAGQFSQVKKMILIK
jgi:photosystem II stability/assembly factor-like uncharacterized protein